MVETVEASVDQMKALAEDPETADTGVARSSGEIVLDKGYHSNESFPPTPIRFLYVRAQLHVLLKVLQ